MDRIQDKRVRYARRRKRVRRKIRGTADRPRLAVYRSLNHIYAQLIDDRAGRTLAAASSVGLKMRGSNVDAAKAVGQSLAEHAKSASIEQACFDRSGRLYHGRVKAVADGAREAGLKL